MDAALTYVANGLLAIAIWEAGKATVDRVRDRIRDRRPYSAAHYDTAPRTLARFASIMQRRDSRAAHRR